MKPVYFLPIGKIGKLEQFLAFAKILDFISGKNTVCLKIHFGEMAHTNQIPANYLKGLINYLTMKKVLPFLVDTNVLYQGARSNTFDHLKVAYKNDFHRLNIPIVIAGGYSGGEEIEVEVNLKHFPKVYVATEIYRSEVIIGLTHFKGHMLAGFGGSLKNIGMGCASRKGKYSQHASIYPKIDLTKCIGCGICGKNCPATAIKLKEKKAYITQDLCIGCGQCIHYCPQKAIAIPWNSTSSQVFQERMVEYAYGALKNKRTAFLNFLINITTDCDCGQSPGEKVVPDIGVLFSTDPVAIDQASVDLVNKSKGYFAEENQDKFLQNRPDIPWHFQLAHGEKIGLGTRTYQLIEFS